MESFFHSGMPWKIFNFVVFVVLLFFVLRKHVVQFWQSRRVGLQTQMNESQQLLNQAEERNRQLQNRLGRIEHEVDELIKNFTTEGELEKQKIVEHAEQQVIRLREDTERIIAQEFRRALELLKREVVQAALQVAEKEIREQLGAEGDRRLGENTLKSLEAEWQS